MHRSYMFMFPLVSALALIPQVTQADNAKKRDEGRSKEAGAATGARHHSSGGSHSTPARNSHSSTQASPDRSDRSSTSESSRPVTSAERRHPRAGTGSGYRWKEYSVPYPHRRYDSYYGSDCYAYSSWDYYPNYYYRPRYQYHYWRRDEGSLRLLIDPSETRVYVDGYYAGVVDDFDGIFQRLHLSPGRHEIVLQLEGYRTYRVKIYTPTGHTVKIHHDMVRGAGEETREERLEGQANDQDRDEDQMQMSSVDENEDDREKSAGDTSKQERLTEVPKGTLRLDVRPVDATVYVDGEFHGTGRQIDHLSLSPGHHRIEVVRPGFRTFEREVEISSRRSLDLEVELERP